MFRQFKFEEPLYQTLSQIPISTQFKLETIGLELPMEIWAKLPLEERSVFCHMAIRSRGERECYCNYLAYVLKREGYQAHAPAPVPEKRTWEELARIPVEVAQKMRDLNLPLFWPDWIKLDDMERYTLCKFCQEGSENPQLQQAVQEFLGNAVIPSASPR